MLTRQPSSIPSLCALFYRRTARAWEGFKLFILEEKSVDSFRVLMDLLLILIKGAGEGTVDETSNIFKIHSLQFLFAFGSVSPIDLPSFQKESALFMPMRMN